MCEISSSENYSAEEFFHLLPPEFRIIVEKIRTQKREGRRPNPSETLIDESKLLDADKRHGILNQVAKQVDMNLCGRSDMCQQFADLLARTLRYLELNARPVLGEAVYFDRKGAELFRWQHAWVRIEDEVVDGNVDVLLENPEVPPTVSIQPYWGPIRATPSDRKLREQIKQRFPTDTDVENRWWPELQDWIDKRSW